MSSSFNFGSASVPNTEFDVFVSFASNDDLPNNLARNGWVTEFVHALEAAVRQRLGSANQPRVFFAKRDLKSNQGAKEALAAMDCSACVVALCSPSYLQDAQAKKECLRLARESESPRRLFVVDVLPVSDEETLPDMLASKRRMPFYARPNATSSVAMSFTPEMSEFHNLIHDLAEQIRSQIKAMQTVHEFSDAARYVRDAAIGKKHVLLAQVTEDIEDQREDVRRYLEQFGHRVLPYESYRQDGATFQKQIAADLAKSDLFVQLLGPNQGRCPPDLPVGYVRAQAAMAFDAQVETCQWRVTSLDPDNVQNPDYRDLLTSATVMASGLEAFKASLRDKLDAPVSTEKNEGDRALQTVFINADESDLEYAKTVRDEFVRNGFLAATPAANPKPDLLKEHLVDCDALVLLYGNASHVWADRNLRLFNKLRARRDRPPKVVAVLLGPPPEKADDLTISMPGLKILGDRKGWNEAHLSDVIKEMRDADA
ncbi:MAG: toll/interleukin-1 receptor domain-containing protein [Pseudomonadota bacterium]